MDRRWTLATAGVALLGAFSFAASAAPVTNAARMGAAAQQTVAIEKAAYRRCWRQGGERHCAWVQGGPRGYGYGYYYGRPRPEAYPTGSTAWWRAMDYEGRGGHGRSAR